MASGNPALKKGDTEGLVSIEKCLESLGDNFAMGAMMAKQAAKTEKDGNIAVAKYIATTTNGCYDASGYDLNKSLIEYTKTSWEPEESMMKINFVGKSMMILFLTSLDQEGSQEGFVESGLIDTSTMDALIPFKM